MPKKEVPIRDFSGGLNTFNATTGLEENESARMYNVTGDRLGVLRLGSSESLHSTMGDKLQVNNFVPGENLHIMQSDYNVKGGFSNVQTNPPHHIIPGNESVFADVTNWSVNTSSTSLTLTANTGLIYAAGHATHGDAYAKWTSPDKAHAIYPHKWYQFYMVIVNTTRTDDTAPTGWLEIQLGTAAGTNNRMRPNKYSTIYNSGTEERGGIYIKPHKAHVNTAYSRVTSSTLHNHTIVVSGVCQAPPTVAADGDEEVYIYGHLNGTDTSSVQTYHIIQFSLAEVPSDIDVFKYDHERHNSEGEIINAYGATWLRWSGTSFESAGLATMKTYDAEDGCLATSETINSATTFESKTASYQGDAFLRVSEGTFTESVDSWILGPVVAGCVDTSEDTLAVHTSNQQATNSSWVPELRTYLSKAQDPNSVFSRRTFHSTPTDQIPTLIVQSAQMKGTADGTTASDYVGLYELCHNGAVAMSVVQGGSSDPEEIDENWKKEWVFGLSYKLRDNSYTNVRRANTHDWETGTDTMWHSRLTDLAYHSGNTDGKHTGITVTFASSSSVNDAIIYVHNKCVMGVEWGTIPTCATNEVFTIASAQIPGTGNIDAKGVVTQRPTDHASDSDSGVVDMTAWLKNPRISLAFKEDLVPPNLQVANQENGEFYNNLYHEDWFKVARPYQVGDNFRDPRINGFIIWDYAKEYVSEHSDTPWVPIMEVDLDKKKFLNYTFDRIEKNLTLDNTYNGVTTGLGGGVYNKNGEFTTYWTTGSGFDSYNVGDAGYHHDAAPNIELTYRELIGYKSDEALKVRYKAATILNGRAIVGNLLRDGRHFADRISVSSALTWDAFPESEARDVSLNDGEDIIALAGFADKLLVFKRKLMYVVNFTDPDSWFVEGSYVNYGVNHRSSVVTSDYGVSWINQDSGVLHFDGSDIRDLTQGKLDYNDLGFGLTNGKITSKHISSIGFEAKSKELYIRIDSNKNGTGDGTVSSPHGWCYSFRSEDWYLNYNLYDNTDDATADAQTNFINTNDGSLVYYRTNSGNSVAYPLSLTGNATGFRTVNPEVRITPGDDDAMLWTREIDFGDPGLDKVIYKVIIRHKYGTNGGTGWKVQGVINGNYDSPIDLTNTLNDDDGTWTITEHECDSQFRNIKTFAIILASEASSDPNFELSSMAVVYRIKHAK